jgi:hypothetical protein
LRREPTFDELLHSELLQADPDERHIVLEQHRRGERDLLAAISAERTAEPPHQMEDEFAIRQHLLYPQRFSGDSASRAVDLPQSESGQRRRQQRLSVDWRRLGVPHR